MDGRRLDQDELAWLEMQEVEAELREPALAIIRAAGYEVIFDPPDRPAPADAPTEQA